MDFVCDFNDLNFCQYSNFGWGFHKSVFYKHRINPISNLPNDANYFPCSVSTIGNEGSRLEKKVALNVSQHLCLHFAYFLEKNGHITVVNGNTKWSKNASSPNQSPSWQHIAFPLSLESMDHLPTLSSDPTVIKITGEEVCVDNFTISTQSCPLTPTTFDNNFSAIPTLWLTQPFSILVAILALVILFTLLGIVSSVVCAKKSQRQLSRMKKLSTKLKLSRQEQCSFENSLQNGATIDSCCDIGSMDSGRFFSHRSRFLPAIVHVRSNPQLVRYSKQSFAASSSVETNDSTPHYRFSLALTEDAQLQLLNNKHNATSPPLSGNLSSRPPQCHISTIIYETSPSPTDIRYNERPGSLVVEPTFCAPILDQSESDVSLTVTPIVQRCDRSRPIRESMNVGYVSDTSLCDLPQYDMAMLLLTDSNGKSTQSSNLVENSDNGDDNSDNGTVDNEAT